jgi:(p)ppGpp synthase/HD superfamily hydrolase
MYSYRIEQAIRAAAVLHKNQVRKGEMPYPYVTHLMSVAFILHDYTDDEDVLVAALLHDSVEDTDYSFEELQEDFGGRVKDIVAAVSEPKMKNGEKLGWAERKKAYYSQLKNGPTEALLVSAADKSHNMRMVVETYHDDHERFLREFGGSLEDRLSQYQELHDLFNARVSNAIVEEFNHVFHEYKQFIHAVQETQQKI